MTRLETTSKSSAAVATVSLEKSLHQTLMLPVGESAPLLFGWWPCTAPWDFHDLTERTTRCLPAVRPGVDVVALPRGVGLEGHWERYSLSMLLQPWQVVFFEARTPFEALMEVSSAFPAQMQITDCCFYPMYVTAEMQELASCIGFASIVG